MTTVPQSRAFGGRYRLSERIASGGMGDVWRATDELLGRNVAIKLLRSEFGDTELFRRRFRFEAQAAASLSHPGIAAVFDYGEEDGDGGDHRAYIVMELVEGESLDVRLRRLGRLGPSPTMDIVGQAARGLQAAHDRGIVHRDVKPANLLIRPDGMVKITDFGIARAIDGSALTQTGAMLGTVQYMSPEQLSGRSATAASDIYALGVVAYNCLAGHTPFVREESMAVALAHVHDDVPPLPADVPDDVSGLVYQMLEKDPARRPASAGDVASIVLELRGGLTYAAPVAADGLPGADRSSVADPTLIDGRTGLTAPGSDGATAVFGRMDGPPTRFDGSDTALFPKAIPLSVLQPLHDNRRRMVVIALGIAAAIILALVLWPSAGPSSATIPNLRGVAAGAAVTKLEKLGLHAKRRAVDGNRTAGLVVTQQPPAGAHVAAGSTVALGVASGYVDLNPTSLVGQPSAQVVSTITGLGLLPVEQLTPSSLAPGSVVSVAPTGRLKLGTSVAVGVAMAPIPTTTTTQPDQGPGGKHGPAGPGPGK